MDENENKLNPIQQQVQNHGQAMGGEAVAVTGSDWRAGLPPGTRLRIVEKMTESLKGRLSTNDQKVLRELRSLTARFEEKTYTEATSQSDYIRKISLKMLSMTTTARNVRENLHGLGAGASQDIQNNIGSTGVPAAAASIPPAIVLNVPAQNQVQQWQGVPAEIHANAQRQVQGRQQEVVNQDQPAAPEVRNRRIRTRAQPEIDPELKKAQLELMKAHIEFEKARPTWIAKCASTPRSD